MPPINGVNGDFVVTVTLGATYAGITKQDTIKIDYTPNAGTCTEIRLVQVVSWVAYDAAGNAILYRPEDIYLPGKNEYGHRNDDEVTIGSGTSARIWSVDHKKCEADPFYNGNDVPQDTSSYADATGATSGHGTCTMTDPPSTILFGFGTANFKQTVASIIKTFETCAICVTTGVVLDCFTWTCKSQKNPKKMGKITVPTTAHPPTGAFDAALKKFCKNHVTKVGTAKKWTCPDKTPKVIKGVIPPPFGRIWATIPNEKSYFYSAPDGEYVGTGQFSDNPDEVFVSIFRAPETSAVKISWSGDQDKTTSSIIFTPLSEISDHTVSTFIPGGDPRFSNDFESLITVQVDLSFFLPFIASLTSKQNVLVESDGPVIITSVANVGIAQSISFIGSLSPSEFQEILNSFIPASTHDYNNRNTLEYLSLNMGTGFSISSQAAYYVGTSQRYSQVGVPTVADVSDRTKLLTWLVIILVIINIIAIVFF